MDIKELSDLAVSMNNYLYDVDDNVDELRKIDIVNSETYQEKLPIVMSKIGLVETKLSQIKYIMKVFLKKAKIFIDEVNKKREELISGISDDLSNKGIIDDITHDNLVLSTIKHERPCFTEIIEISDPKEYTCLSLLRRLIEESNNDIEAALLVYDDLASAESIIDAALCQFRELRDTIRSPEFINAIQNHDYTFMSKFKYNENMTYGPDPDKMKENIEHLKDKAESDNPVVEACMKCGYTISQYFKELITALFRALKALNDNFVLYTNAVNAYKKTELQNLLPYTNTNIEIM